MIIAYFLLQISGPGIKPMVARMVSAFEAHFNTLGYPTNQSTIIYSYAKIASFPQEALFGTDVFKDP